MNVKLSILGSESEEDFEKQPVVIGGFDKRASESLKCLYEELERRSCMNFEIFVTNSLIAVADTEIYYVYTPPFPNDYTR